MPMDYHIYIQRITTCTSMQATFSAAFQQIFVQVLPVVHDF